MANTFQAAFKVASAFRGRPKNGEALSPYYDNNSIAKGVARGKHRDLIGGLWNEVGQWQFDLLVAQGLKPHHRLLDVGCGSFRGGVKFVDYLESGNYFGIDLNWALINAGYEREIKKNGLAEKLPRENLAVTDSFSCDSFGGGFDFALAVSVFTHLPVNHWRVALENLAPEMKLGGIFLATYFPCAEAARFSDDIVHSPANVVSHGTMDPYHCRLSDVEHMTVNLPWAVATLDVDNHPRGQKVVRFRRTD